MNKKFLLLTSLILNGLLGGTAMATPEPNYDVLVDVPEQNIQIRKYAPVMVAEVMEQNGENNAFMQLFRYIDGANIAQQNIAMTAPVTQQENIEIPMTAPVTQTQAAEKNVMTFFLPSEFTPKNTPQPTNTNITVKRKPSEVFAVIQFSGLMRDKSIEEHRMELEKYLKNQAIEPIGPYLTAGYNAPWTPWFLRRNEIWFPLNPETEYTQN